MKKGLFRKSALDKIASLDQLDQTMTVVKPSSILAVISVAIVVGVGVIWGFFGTLPETVTGSGVLVNTENISSVKSPNQGTLKNIFVSVGDIVSNGQIVARIERQDLLDQIKSNEKKMEGLNRMKDVLISSNKNGGSRQKTMKRLYDSGLITQSEYYNSMQTEINVEQQITELKQQIAALQDSYEMATRVVATADGRVIELSARRGDYMQPGRTVLIIESVGNKNAVEALIYFPAEDGKKIETGMRVGIIPTTVKQEEFGYIQGLISEISEFPVGDNYLLASLQNDALVNTFRETKNPIEVRVSIIPDPNTYSGYKWSSSRGPAKKINVGSLCAAKVTTDTKKPIDLVIPTLKKKLLGIGE